MRLVVQYHQLSMVHAFASTLVSLVDLPSAFLEHHECLVPLPPPAGGRQPSGEAQDHAVGSDRAGCVYAEKDAVRDAAQVRVHESRSVSYITHKRVHPYDSGQQMSDQGSHSDFIC
jgi:hypothetical protein